MAQKKTYKIDEYLRAYIVVQQYIESQKKTKKKEKTIKVPFGQFKTVHEYELQE